MRSGRQYLRHVTCDRIRLCRNLRHLHQLAVLLAGQRANDEEVGLAGPVVVDDLARCIYGNAKLQSISMQEALTSKALQDRILIDDSAVVRPGRDHDVVHHDRLLNGQPRTPWMHHHLDPTSATAHGP